MELRMNNAPSVVSGNSRLIITVCELKSASSAIGVSKMIKHLFCAVLMISSVAHAQMEAEAGHSLLSFYHAAQAYDARFNAAISNQEAGHEQLPLARSQLLPDISLTANIAYNNQETNYSGSGPFSSGRRDFSSDAIGIRLIQPLYRKERFEAYKQAKVAVRQSDTQFAIAKQQLILDVSSSYFNVLLAQEGLTLAKAEKAANKKQLARAKRGFEVGSAAITDVYDAQARFDLSLSEEIDAHKRLQIARRSLAKLTGISPQALSAPQQKRLLPLPAVTMEQWAERASSASLTVRLTQESLEIAKHEIERNRGFVFPKLDLVVSYDDSSADDSSFGTGIDTTEARIMLEASVPLYSGGSLTSKLRQKRAEHRRAQQQLEATRRDAILQAEEAYLSYESGSHRIKALQQALLSSEKSLASSQRGFELGLHTGIDVLDAQRQFYAAKLKLAEARYGYLFDRLRLEAAAGQLDEEDLGQIDALTD